jgi:hypothetical protein
MDSPQRTGSSVYLCCAIWRAATFRHTICKEVQVEFVVGKFKFVHDAHAQMLVEFDAGLGIFHPVFDRCQLGILIPTTLSGLEQTSAWCG